MKKFVTGNSDGHVHMYVVACRGSVATPARRLPYPLTLLFLYPNSQTTFRPYGYNFGTIDLRSVSKTFFFFISFSNLLKPLSILSSPDL